MSRLRRILLILVSVLLILALLGGGFGIYTVRRSFPQVKGEIRLTALDAAVDVYRDVYGVPHIYAETTHDLFFAQGYVHAQERFWQMDFSRHIGAGRLSEMFGESQLKADTFLRAMGFTRTAQQEAAAADADFQTMLQSYADGVNAYLADHQGSALSLEYAVLGLLNPDYQPEPWKPEHSLSWAKVMAYNLGGNLDEEILRTSLLKTLTPEQLAELYPPAPAENPIIVPVSGGAAAQKIPRQVQVAALRTLDEGLLRSLAQMDDVLGKTGGEVGSNNWVVSGAHTASGKPLLANDPHLGEQMPSIWFQVGLHCTKLGPECPYDVAGFSFAGVPGVIVGHNQRIAWGVTNEYLDTQDLYIEKINPANPDQYEVNGEWVDMQISEETLQVNGGEAVKLRLRHTRHGIVLSDFYAPLEDTQGSSALPQDPAPYALALRWTVLEPSTLLQAFAGFNKAQNWDEFRAAARFFDIAAQNIVYADVDGNIGYQSSGEIPMRASGDGYLPVPGWTDEYEWLGYIPFEEMPSLFNPAQGFIVTANNTVVDDSYPYVLSRDIDLGYRARRITEMISGAPGPVDMAYMQMMQGDNRDMNAERLAPLLLQIELNDPSLEARRAILVGWDYQADADSAPAALFEVFWRHLLQRTFHDDLPEFAWPTGGDRWIRVAHNLSQQPDSAWWDDQTTPEIEKRDDILRLALADAVEELERTLGKDAQRWQWGKLHTLTFRNQSLGKSGVTPIEALFNRGPFYASGGRDIVNATGWDTLEGYQVLALPSLRMIVDFSDVRQSAAIHTTGQSGHAYHEHYVDMAPLWVEIMYHPMLWERGEIEKGAEAHLRLAP